MPFNLGEIWVSTSGRRAAVCAVDDDGRRGQLFFDNGEQEWVNWMQLTQAGQWHVDTGPKSRKTAEELKTLVLARALQHPVCPEGMSVVVRGVGKGNWRVDSVPPLGQSIGYTDCADHISKTARLYGLLYALAD
jgi:hypothetical protein